MLLSDTRTKTIKPRLRSESTAFAGKSKEMTRGGTCQL